MREEDAKCKKIGRERPIALFSRGKRFPILDWSVTFRLKFQVPKSVRWVDAGKRIHFIGFVGRHAVVCLFQRKS